MRAGGPGPGNRGSVWLYRSQSLVLWRKHWPDKEQGPVKGRRRYQREVSFILQQETRLVTRQAEGSAHSPIGEG